MNATSLAGTHIVIVFAEDDRRYAERLWTALRAQELSVGLFDQTVGTTLASHLVLLCSPAAVRATDVTHAIESFLEAHERDRSLILPLAVEADTPTFPPVLLSERDSEGFLTPISPPPTAGKIDSSEQSLRRLADVLSARIGKPGGNAAPAGEIRYRLAPALTAGTALLAIGAITWGTWNHMVASENAERARASQEFASRLVVELTDQLPAAARRDTLISIADEMMQSFGLETESDADELQRRAQILHFIGEARDVHGDPDGARESFQAAFDITAQLLQETPNEPERIFAHSQSAFWLGNSAYRAGDLSAAMEALEAYKSLSDQLVSIDEDNPLYLAEAGHAANNLGIMALENGNPDRAADLLDQGIRDLSGRPLEEGVVTPADIANVQGWRANAYLARGQLRPALESRRAEVSAYRAQLVSRPDDYDTREALARALREYAVLLTMLGDVSNATVEMEESLNLSADLFSESPSNSRARRIYMIALSDRARLALRQDDLTRAQLLQGEARRVRTLEDEQGSDDERHLERGMIYLLGAEIAMSAGAHDVALSDASQAILAAEQALGAGYAAASELAAEAYFLHGEALSGAQRSEEAENSYRQARDRLADRSLRSFRERDLLSRITLRLGDGDIALDLHDALIEDGYAHPEFIAFWQQQALTAQLQSSPAARN
ncbi:hypothetical protein E5163_10200 [Marinicauda algicola]|uniref:TIR domain-containing protein n=1 Tax=Marinicauda algicola TaxID=2029849 RepID=A0A4S2GYF3_9PROT|nr:toll/interleukin-1 receptor domain-containing protein [Marinicauda algicola]TGY88195.1 hypothetical protein E5163_10200 [Marinicauda algicola]